MNRKAKKKTKGVDAHVDGDGFLCLKGTLFWKYRAVESDFARVQMELNVKTNELHAVMAKYDDIKAIFAARQALLSEVSIKKGEVLAVQAEVEKLFGISLKNCAFDDRTGRITEILPTGIKQPIKPRRRPRSRS